MIMRKFSKVLSLAAAVAMLMSAGPANAALQAVGPTSTVTTLPAYYQDLAGLALAPCLDQNTFCVLTPEFDPLLTANPLPITTTGPVNDGNMPSEIFYFLADAKMAVQGPLGGDTAVLRLALEAAFFPTVLNGPIVAPGNGATFMRINLKKMSGLTPLSTYTVTHPFGTFQFTTLADGTTDLGLAGQAFRVQDPFAGGVPGIFFPADMQAATNTHIGPFLVTAGGPVTDPVTGNKYIGNPNLPSALTGSPLGTNVFRIDGPGIGGIGIDTIQTTLFALSGKMMGLDISPAGPQDYLTWVVGATSTPKTFTVTNQTGALTGIPAIVPPAGYTLTANTCTVALNAIAPGNTCTFNISFAPTVNGIASGNVTINAAGAPTATIAVTGDGEGTIPSVAITGISRITTLTSQLLSGTASDFGHPVASVTAVVTPLGGVAGPLQTATLSPGGGWTLALAGLTPNTVNNIAVTATDVALPAGNTNTVNDSIVVDTIPPAVSLTAPVNGSLSNIKAPLLTFTATDVNLAATIVQVDGTIVNKVSGNTLDLLADGTHTVAVDASDGAGTHTIVTNSITVDATPPVIAVTSPKVVNGRVGSKTPALTFTVNDAHPVPANTVVRLDGVVVPAGTASIGPFTVASNHTLTVDAMDGAGNISPTTTLAFTIVLADGRVVSLGASPPTIADALLTLKSAVGINPLVGDQFSHADVAPLDANGIPNPNGTVDISDALVILKVAVGLIVI
jgi:hypothetical protein